MRMKHIVPNPVIGGQYVHISPLKHLSGPVDGCQSIFTGIFRIIKQLYLIFVNQIFKFFFQITYGNCDIIDTGFMKLADLPFNHAFSKYLQKPFGSFKGQGNKTGTKACGNNQGSVYLKILKKLQPLIGQLTGTGYTFSRRQKFVLNTFLK